MKVKAAAAAAAAAADNDDDGGDDGGGTAEDAVAEAVGYRLLGKTHTAARVGEKPATKRRTRSWQEKYLHCYFDLLPLPPWPRHCWC